MFKKRLVALLCGAVVVSGLAVGCGSGDDEKGGTSKITVSGSTSVGPTMEVLAQAYEKNNDVKIEVQQVGSSAGIKNTIEGTSDLGMSSRDLKDEEAQSVDGTQIAIDGIAVVTHKDNKVTDLTIDQVKDIFMGKITNWKEVGGEDAQICDGSGAVKSTIQGNKNAIGYISFGYVKDDIKSVKIDGVEANDDNVVNGTYAISRPFLVVNKKDNLSEEAKSFVDFILSEEGQNIVSEEGFIKATIK